MDLPLGIQPDFGRFDPKFLGVTLKVGSRRAHDLLRRAEDVTRDQVESKPADQGFEMLSLLTALVHETRHFHDFLLAPFGGLVTRRRFTAFINARQVFEELLSSSASPEGNVLPVPFRSWCQLDLKAREEEAGYWRLRDGDRVISLPCFEELEASPSQTQLRPSGPDLFPAHVALALAQYRTLEETFTSFAPYEMSEASALLMQAQEIWRAFGKASAELFVGTLQGSRRSPYGRSLWLLFELMAAMGSEPEAKRMSEIVTWTMLGDVFEEGVGAASLRRFALLTEHLSSVGYPDSEMGIVDLFAKWDAATGCVPTLPGLHSSLARDDNFAEQLDRALALSPQIELLDDLAEKFEMIRRARRAMVEEFFASPEDYVYPVLYQEKISKFVRPPVLFEFEGGVLHVPDDDTSYTLVKARKGKDGRTYASVVALPHDESGTSAIDLSCALQLRGEIAVADVLFSTQAPDPVDWEISRQEFERDGFLVRQVIN